MDTPLLVSEWKKLTKTEQNIVLQRTHIDIDALTKKVRPIMEDVKKNGDKAVLHYNKIFDTSDIPLSKMRVSPVEFKEAEDSLSDEVKKAMSIAYRNVNTYHQLSIEKQNIPFTEISSGIFIGEKITPIDSVALYVPSGKGVFPSMVYMLGIPAQLAKVPRIVMISPPNQHGAIDPACLYAAQMCGITEVYKMGGAHGIAALSYGTKTIAPVIKIIGPGSGFVTAAKQYVNTLIDIGIPAGPSESLIIADGTTSAELAAYDLCIEAEHGADSMALLITHKKDYAEQVAKHLGKIIANAPKKQAAILKQVFKKYKAIILCSNEEESIAVANDIASEHLMIHSESPSSILSKITNAGEILLGTKTPFSLANYAAGANAVLPTGSMAKTFSAVSVQSFTKKTSIIKITKKGYDDISPHVQTLAEYEGFYFHKQALVIRDEKQQQKNSKKNT